MSNQFNPQDFDAANRQMQLQAQQQVPFTAWGGAGQANVYHDPYSDSMNMRGGRTYDQYVADVILGVPSPPKDEQVQQTQNVKKESYMKELLQDARNFIKEHRTVIYTVALVVLIDHFVFGGQFRDKLKDLTAKFLKKAEDQLHIGTKQE